MMMIIMETPVLTVLLPEIIEYLLKIEKLET